MKYILTLFLLLNSSFLLANTTTDYLVVPQVKKLVVSYVLENRNSSDAYNKLKELTFDAMDYIKTEQSSDSFDKIVNSVMANWKGDSSLLSKKQIAVNILAAVNN